MSTKLESVKQSSAPSDSAVPKSGPPRTINAFSPLQVAAIASLLGGVFWVYWRDLLTIESQWDSNPHYSHGYLVPLFAIVLLVTRRNAFRPSQWSASWWGFVLLAAGLGLKLYSSYYYIESLSHLSLLVVLSSIPAALWGAKGLKWALPGLAFLIFMLPLPHRLEGAMQGPLRSVGTKASTFFLQTVGFKALNEGHVIVVWQESLGKFESIGVAEACSGLNMLMVFFALSTAVALMLTESGLFRLILVVSAVPIAIAANILRIAATAAVIVLFADSTVFGMPGSEFAHKFFHDWAGWFMMPIGLLMLWMEIWVLEHLVIRVPDQPVSALATHSLTGAQDAREAT